MKYMNMNKFHHWNLNNQSKKFFAASMAVSMHNSTYYFQDVMFINNISVLLYFILYFMFYYYIYSQLTS